MNVKKLIIHHSFTKDGQVVDWTAIKRYHTSWRYNGRILSEEEAQKLQARGIKVEAPWSDVGYHYGIERVGDQYVVQKGRPESMTGAHTVGMNSQSLGICVVGNFDKDTLPPEAMKALVDLCAEKCRQYHLSAHDIVTHHQYAVYKTCPGTRFPMEELKIRVKERLEGVE